MIRKCEDVDFEPLAQLWADGWNESHLEHTPPDLTALRTLPDFLRRLREMGDDLRVCGPVGAPSGFCAVKKNEIYQIYVAKSARGSGVAKSLLHDGEARIAARGYKEAKLDVIIPNTNARSKDYSQIKDIFRPGHADYTYQAKYKNRDYRGGGRSSARVTAGWVAAGAMAESYLKEKIGIEIIAYTQSVGGINCPPLKEAPTKDQVDAHAVRCPHAETAEEMQQYIKQLKAHGDSIGGTINCTIKNVPAGLGEPVFGKFNALLAQYMMSINAVKSIAIGDANNLLKTGSELSDEPGNAGHWNTKENKNNGLLGGISTGETIAFTLGFKAPSSIAKAQTAFDADFNPISLEINGRHDPCVLPRAIPIVETMCASLILDLYLESKTN